MMVGPLISVIALAPFFALTGCLLTRHARVAEALNLVAAGVAFACALPLPFIVDRHARIFWDNYVIVDRSSVWVVLCTAIVYFLASIFAVGYMRLLDEDERLRQFYALFAGFALTTLIAPLMNNIGIYWIVIELTTLVSTFLVAFENAAESTEAAWKYIMVVSAGISLALLGTMLFYFAGTFVSRPHLCDDLGSAGGRSSEDEPGTLDRCLSSRARRLRNKGGSCAHAQLVARCP